MPNTWTPSDTYPGIEVERLVALAAIVRAAREQALLAHDPAAGESSWSLGVRAFERTNRAVVVAAAELEWLTIVQGFEGGPVQFVFNISGHPVRVCRGDSDDVPHRYRQPCIPELEEQQKLADLEFGPSSPTGRCLRLVVENDALGAPNRIYLAEIDEETGLVVNTYLIPAVAVPSNATPFGAPPAPAVALPPVHAEAIEDDEEATGSHDA